MVPSAPVRAVQSLVVVLIVAAFSIMVGGTVIARQPAEPPDASPISTRQVQVPTGIDEPTHTLVTTYAPILRIGNQLIPCDTIGDPFNPSAADLVLNNERVVLRKGNDTPPLVQGPTASDLYQQSSALHLDLPGNPRSPGCRYEEFYRDTVGNSPAVSYAHVVIDTERHEVVVQYWFYYLFNRWNNTHESDWEMIMVIFPGTSPAEAMAHGPDRLAYAQHAGGRSRIGTMLTLNGTAPIRSYTPRSDRTPAISRKGSIWDMARTVLASAATMLLVTCGLSR